MRNRKRYRLTMALRLGCLIIPAAASAGLYAETISGHINGQTCAENGHTCPAENLDPRLSFELDFVLQQADGSYYFLSNVPRDTKVRHVLKDATARGRLNAERRTMLVDQLMVRENGSYKTVWTPMAQQQAFEEVFSDGWFGSGDGASRQ